MMLHLHDFMYLLVQLPLLFVACNYQSEDRYISLSSTCHQCAFLHCGNFFLCLSSNHHLLSMSEMSLSDLLMNFAYNSACTVTNTNCSFPTYCCNCFFVMFTFLSQHFRICLNSTNLSCGIDMVIAIRLYYTPRNSSICVDRTALSSASFTPRSHNKFRSIW